MTRRDLSRLMRSMPVGMAISLPWVEGLDAYQIARQLRDYAPHKHTRFGMSHVWTKPVKVKIRRLA